VTTYPLPNDQLPITNYPLPITNYPLPMTSEVMSQQKELEIKRLFLEEAQDYLKTLEAALLGLAHRQVDQEEINAALRAAHSIKGGAGMMGFGVLSKLAHRLEDSFKVLKTQKSSVQIDAELEGLLLAGVDCLRTTIARDRDTLLVPDSPDNGAQLTWLASHAEPIFDWLHERLGEPGAEDAASVLAPEEGQDIIPLLFETEVEGCLQRLESVLADPQLPCLREELEILAQELGGLGEMLQISAFSQLCQSVADQLTIAPDQVEAIAQVAIAAWRQSQALILTGQMALLPCEISLPLLATNTTETSWELPAEFEPQAEIFSFSALDDETLVLEQPQEQLNSADDETLVLEQPQEQLNSADDETLILEQPEEQFNFAQQESDFPFSIFDFGLEEDDTATGFIGEENPKSEIPNPKSEIQDPKSTDFQVLEVQPDDVAATFTAEDRDATVRVPLKYLEQLNDLFGELTIERNGLNLQLKRLQNLNSTLSKRLSRLDRANRHLQSAYDKLAIEEIAVGNKGLGNTAQHYSHTNGGNFRAGIEIKSPAKIQNRESKIDTGFDLLEMDRYSDLHLLGGEVMETIVQIQEVKSDIELSLEETEQTVRELDKTSKQMQTRLDRLRMRPLSDILDRFPVALRELSLQHGKPVDLKIHGNRTLVDRNILEALHDPLMHLLRNAFDHGIEDPVVRQEQGKPEQGLIEIKANHRSNRTLITIKDDGKGIPIDKIRTTASDRDLLSLIFEPGFTTKEEVTDLSGRGVGMDVVRNNLKQIQGDIQVDTQPGVGTTFTISVPYTLSVTRVLLAESNGMLLAFPADAISQIVSLEGESDVLDLEGNSLPLLRPERWLKFNGIRHFHELEMAPAINKPAALIASFGNQSAGIVVNSCWREREVTIRRLEGDLPLPPGFSGCAILGDGRVVPLVDVPEFLNWVSRSQPIAEPSLPLLERVATTLQPLENTILIVDDSINVRRFLALTLEKAGYRVEQAKDGQDALDKLQGGLTVSATICDIEMPHLDGYGFLAQVKANANFKQMPVIMLTSRSGNKHRQLAMNLGAVAYFSKPYNEQALLQTLETQLAS
jgi:two-component system, chemotaxis family, sensor histidine kinase and response regulator PixL